MAVKPTSARPAAWPVTSPIPDRLAAIAVAVPGNDANNAVSNGWYLLAPTTANRGPINQYAVLRADVIDATNVFQPSILMATIVSIHDVVQLVVGRHGHK